MENLRENMSPFGRFHYKIFSNVAKSLLSTSLNASITPSSARRDSSRQRCSSAVESCEEKVRDVGVERECEVGDCEGGARALWRQTAHFGRQFLRAHRADQCHEGHESVHRREFRADCADVWKEAGA